MKGRQVWSNVGRTRTVKNRSTHKQNLSQCAKSNINPMWNGLRSNPLKTKMCNFVIVKL